MVARGHPKAREATRGRGYSFFCFFPNSCPATGFQLTVFRDHQHLLFDMLLKFYLNLDSTWTNLPNLKRYPKRSFRNLKRQFRSLKQPLRSPKRPFRNPKWPFQSPKQRFRRPKRPFRCPKRVIRIPKWLFRTPKRPFWSSKWLFRRTNGCENDRGRKCW